MMNDTTNKGGPAFPGIRIEAGDNYNPPKQYHMPGMRLRDYFAAKAMHASMSLDPANAASSEEHARWAYEMADAMLKARGQA